MSPSHGRRGLKASWASHGPFSWYSSQKCSCLLVCTHESLVQHGKGLHYSNEKNALSIPVRCWRHFLCISQFEQCFVKWWWKSDQIAASPLLVFPGGCFWWFREGHAQKAILVLGDESHEHGMTPKRIIVLCQLLNHKDQTWLIRMMEIKRFVWIVMHVGRGFSCLWSSIILCMETEKNGGLELSGLRRF